MSSFRYGRNFVITGALMTLLGTLPACVTSSDFDRLRSQVYHQDLERKKQEERIAKLETELSQSKPVQANSWAEMNAMRTQMATLSGQVDDMRRAQEMQRSAAGGAVTLEGLNAQVRDLERKNMFMASQLGVVFDEMPASPAAQPSAGAVPQTSPAPAAAPAQPKTAAVQPAPATTMAPAGEGGEQPVGEGPGQDLYQKALENFYAKKYKAAQTTWAEFVKGFPKDPLVPNAIFWQGESFFQMQDYANAVLTYQKVIEEHSKSNKYRAALLKQGISFYKLKKDQAGKLVLEDLIKKYPDSAEAKRAQAYLKSGN